MALAYLLVWAWHEHVVNSELIHEKPQHSIVLLIDEMEAHLHPSWQRSIVPAILKVVRALSAKMSTQVIIATHSPLILASVEPFFDEDQDRLFHLYLDYANNSVQLDHLPFVKRGRADQWLTSEVFGLTKATREVPPPLEGVGMKASPVAYDSLPYFRNSSPKL